jgi:hypothetical protein
MQSRRAHLRSLLGMAALAGIPRAAHAGDPPIPPEGIGHRIKHLSYSDIGGRPDSIQIMSNRNHLYVGHMFSDGITILDASDPRRLDGANIVAMQSYSDQRGYFENSLSDSITKRKNFRSGLSIHDISKPTEMREIAFLEMPGLGINRLSWMGGRYAYVSAHFDGFTDHCLCIVDLQEITKPVIVSKWWLPGMNRTAGEVSDAPKGKRYALHHMIVAGSLGYGAWRDGGFTIHDVSDAARPKLLSHINWSPPFPGGTHTPLPLPGRNLAVVADEANAEKCAKGLFQIFVLDVRSPQNPVTVATMPVPRDRDYCTAPGTFGPHNLHENRPGSFQSEETIFATYNAGGVRVFDLRDQYAPKELAYWLPPPPAKMIDPRPSVTLAAKTADIYVTRDGLIYASDWNAGLHVLEYQG